MLGSSPTSFNSYSYQEKAWWFIAAGVILFHVLGVWFGAFWTPSFPQKESRQRVVVKTVALNPRLQPPAEVSAPSVPPPVLPPHQEIAAKVESAPAPVPVKEKEEPPKKEEPAAKQEKPEPVLNKEVPTPAAAPAPTPIPKPEKKAAAKAAAPAPKKAAPAQKPQTPAPVKKQTEPVKKAAKIEKQPTVKDKAAEEAEKKRQKEQAAAKEAEKQRQKEIAAAKEAERVRQQEIAAVQEAAKKKQQELLAKAKENLSKAGETRDKIQSTSSVKLSDTDMPKAIEHLQIDAIPVGSGTPTELTAKEITYRDEVAQRLKLNLRLPDYGAVKIKLTLDRSGKVAQVIIVSSESQKNKQYIEKTVPTISFPPFGGQFAGAAQYTFLITLNNDY